MAKVSKRVKEFRSSVDKTKTYSIEQALELIKSTSKAKFDESIDISVNLGIDARKSDQNVRGAIVLPNGIGKSVKVAVFAQGEAAEKAKALGVEEVGMEDLAEKFKNEEISVDVVIATPDTMRVVGQLGQVLGPKGLMPNPKVGTVTPDVETAIKNAQSGQVRFRNSKQGIVSSNIGKISFEPNQIKENIEAFLIHLVKLKPSTSKGVFLKKITVSSTMGPGVWVDSSSLNLKS